MQDSPETTPKDLEKAAAAAPGKTPDPQAEQEFDFPRLEIPYNREEDHEASREELRKFFLEDHPEALERLIYCPMINRDVTDDAGMFGFDPGYIYIVDKGYPGKRTLNDDTFLRVAYSNLRQTESGVAVPQIPQYEDFPRLKYEASLITEHHSPRTYQVVNEILNTPKPPAVGQ